MAWDRGMGTCLIPTEAMRPCSRQIAEGDPVGTIMVNRTPIVGHKRCADEYYRRVQESERAKRETMVKRINQSGPGGPVDPSTATDAVMGSLPLEKPEPLPPIDPERAMATFAAQGVPFIGDVPMDASPSEAVEMASTRTATASAPGRGGSPGSWGSVTLPRPGTAAVDQQAYEEVPAMSPILHDYLPEQSLPQVQARDGMVCMSGFKLDSQGQLRLEPEDAEFLVQILEPHIKRAWRQRQ